LDGSAKGYIKHPSKGSNVHSNGSVNGPDYLLVRIRNFRLDVKIRRDDGTEAQPTKGYSARVEVVDPLPSRHNQGCTKEARILGIDLNFQVLPQILQLEVGVGFYAWSYIEDSVDYRILELTHKFPRQLWVRNKIFRDEVIEPKFRVRRTQ
jgi:hypothetical protein